MVSAKGVNSMIKPLHKFVLIKKEEKENKTASGIVLTTEKKEVPSIASVIAVGDECTSSLKENDRVIYKEYSGTKVTVADQDYIVIDEKDIIVFPELFNFFFSVYELHVRRNFLINHCSFLSCLVAYIF